MEEIIQYPCDIKQGDKIKTSDGRIREVESIDGRFISFVDGSSYSLSHPDIIGVVQEKRQKKKTKEDNSEE